MKNPLPNDRDDCCVFILDYLRDGPAQLDALYHDAWKHLAFDRYEVQDTLTRLCIETMTRPQDGAVFVMLPANLVAIWWAKGRLPNHWPMAAGGDAA